jgi:two-component system sensor histidine kinase TctE
MRTLSWDDADDDGEALSDVGTGGCFRFRLFISLTAVGVMSLLPAIHYIEPGQLGFVLLGGFLVALVVSWCTSGWLVLPVEELRNRLAQRNYGEDPKQRASYVDGDEDGELSSILCAVMCAITSMRPQRCGPMGGRLPQELAEIESLARAGVIADMAMQSISRDIYRHLSHQIKSPLALVRAHTELARTEAVEGRAEGVPAHMDDIEKLIFSLSALVDQLLALGYVDGLLEHGLVTSPVNLSIALARMLRERRRIGDDRGVTIQSEIEAGLWVKGEASLLTEMVAALVDNAVRYTGPSTRVSVRLYRVPATRTIAVEVVDQGPGIPPSERKRVFTPFYGSTGRDANNNVLYGTRRHRAFEGAGAKSSHGLGLSLVRAVARLHGANIVLDAGPGGRGLLARVMLTACAAPIRDGEDD